MSVDVSDSAGVHFSFPVWIVVDTAEFERVGLPGGAELVDAPPHGPLFLFFTDEGRALRFIAGRGRPGKSTFLIAEPDHLRFLLEIYDEMGVDFVGIDCPTPPTARDGAGHYLTLRQVLRTLAAVAPA
jgi:hypothetical protein